MKRNIFVAALLLLFISCTQQQSDQLTQQQKDQIKKDVKVVVDSMVAKFESLDVNAAFQYYWDSPNFLALNADGSRSDFQASKKGTIDFFNSATSVKISTTFEDYKVMTKDLVICAWVGKEDVALKSGDKVLYDPIAESLVFGKVADQWKVIYNHESATFTTQKAGKK
jgi:ketosteroid isomerase-like protein